MVLDHWEDFDGWAASRSIEDIQDMPLSRFVNLVWYWATRKADDPNEVEKFRNRIWQPPKGEIAKGPWAAENEMALFAAAKAKLVK